MPEALINHIIDLGFIVLFGLLLWGSKVLYAKLPPDLQLVLQRFASMIVPAIAQEFGDMSNPEKKTVAMNRLREALNAVGVKGIPDSVLSSAIEAAVYDLKQDVAAKASTPLIGFAPAASSVPATDAKLVNRK